MWAKRTWNRPHIGRAAGAAACAAAGIGGLVAFTAVTAYPFSAAARPPLALAALAYMAAAAAVGVPSAALLRRAGGSWEAALTADGFTYAPLALLWIAARQRPSADVVPLLAWAAVGALCAAKLALLARLARPRLLILGASAAARGFTGFALRLSAIGRAVAPFTLIALTAYWRAIHLYEGLAVAEQGLLAHLGQAILGQQIPYRDLSSVFPPGLPYLHAGAFAALGTNLVTSNIVLAAGPVLTSLGAYLVAGQIMPAGLAFAAALAAALAGDGGLAMFLALCAIGMGFARSGDRRANWLMAGLVLGLATAFDLVLGLAAAGGLAAMLWLRQRRFVMRRVGAQRADLALGPWALMPLALGAVTVWAPILAYFASRGALGASWGDLVAGSGGAVFALLRPPACAEIVWSRGALYAAGAMLVAWRVVNRRLGEAEFAALTLILFGAIAWGWAVRTGDAYHLALSAPAAVIVAALLLGWAAKAVGQSLVGWPPWDHLRVVRAWVAALVLAGVSAACVQWARAAVGSLSDIAVDIALPRGAAVSDRTPFQLPAGGGVYMPAHEAFQLAAVVDYVQTHSAPQEPVFCAPGAPALYFLTDRPNATRLDYVYDRHVGMGDVAQAVVDLELRKVRLVVLAPPAAPWQQGLNLEPLIASYLARHYHRAARLGEYVILLREGASMKPRPVRKQTPPAPTELVPSPWMFAPRG